MVQLHSKRIIASTLLLTLAMATVIVTVSSLSAIQSGPILSLSPSSIIVKVGGSAQINISATGLPDSQGKICFTVADFPSSGFVTSINPPCETAPFHGSAISVLIVEATPAAAPQNFNASVIATGGSWTSQVPLSVTVIPAMPAWIPWSIILVFLLIVIIPVLIRRKRTQQSQRK